MEKIKPLRKSQFAPEDAPEKEQPACPHPHLSGPEAGCRLCRIEVDKLTVSFGAQTPLKDVSLHIHCG